MARKLKIDTETGAVFDANAEQDTTTVVADAPPVVAEPEAVRPDGSDSEDSVPDGGGTSHDELGGLGIVSAMDAKPEVTEADKAAALELVNKKIEPVNAAIKAAGVTHTDENGNTTRVESVFEVLPLETNEPDTFPCPVCSERFKDAPGLKRHITRKHDGNAEPRGAAPAREVDVPADDGVRPERTAAVTPIESGFSIDAVDLFDNILAAHLPPPLTDFERDLLRQVGVKVTLSPKMFKFGVLAFIFLPRMMDKFTVLKARFDEQVREREAAQEAAKRRVAAEKHRQEAAERATIIAQAAPIATGEPVITEPASEW